jgi:glucokinase
VNGIVLATPTLAGFVDVPLARMLEERMDLPVLLENDGFAAALGEWRSGAGRGYQNMVYITVSTGIGGGVILDGRLVRGRRGLAGHVGHVTIVRDGELCACGNRGCWEAYASGPAFARRGRLRAESEAKVPTTLGIGGAPIDGRAIFEAAQQGDRLASSLVLEEADLLGVGIVNLLHLFSPDLVVIGGGMSNGFDLLLPGIAARISSGAMPPFQNIPIVRAALGDNSGLVGAASLVFDAS